MRNDVKEPMISVEKYWMSGQRQAECACLENGKVT